MTNTEADMMKASEKRETLNMKCLQKFSGGNVLKSL